MKMKLQLALIIITLAGTVRSQVSAYAFSQSMSSYSNTFTGPYIGHAYQNDTVNVFPLPFPFTFNGTSYTSVNLSSNGFISFNNITGTEYFPISDLNTQNVISAFGQDLHTGMLISVNIAMGSNVLTGASSVAGLKVGDSIRDLNGDFSLAYPIITAINGNNITINGTALITSTGYDIHVNNGCIRTALSGSTPTRVCEIEYQNFSRFNVFNEFINFKIKLYETYNRVAIVYGTAAPGSSVTTSEIGLKGNSISDFNSRLVTSSDTYITSKTASLVTHACEVSPSKMTSSGVTYAWQPYCPVPGLVTSHTSPTVCAGESVTLSATSSAQTYSWVGIDTTAQVIVTPSANVIYTLVARWGFCRDTVLFSQTVNPSPTVSVSKSSAYICAGQTMTITASGANSFSWTNISAGSQVTVNPGSTTVYTVTGTSDGCSDTELVTATVAPLPVLTVQQSHTMACKGWSVSLFAQGASSYQWSNSSPLQGISFTAQNTGTYMVTGTSSLGCVSQKTILQQVQDCTGLNEEGLAGLATIYPNPFGSMLYIRQSGSVPLRIVVKDVTGRVIADLYVENDHQLSTDNWSPGAYIMGVTDGERRFTQRLIKE